MASALANADVASRPTGGETDLFHPGVIARYALALGLVGVATVLAFVVEHIVAAPNLALIFVLPVLVAAVGFGWGPSLFAAVMSVVAFDLFFVEPRYSLRVDSPSDLWALSLLLVVGAIASTVAAEGRRRALEAEAATVRAEALRALAHQVVEAAPAAVLVATARAALEAIFGAPAVVLRLDPFPFELNQVEGDKTGRRLISGARSDRKTAHTFADRDLGGAAPGPAVLSNGIALSSTEAEAARWALDNALPVHAQAYPFDGSRVSFWPVGQGIVLGVLAVDRPLIGPQEAARNVELVGAYLVAGLGHSRDTQGSPSSAMNR